LPNSPQKSRYYDKLPDLYQLKSPQDTTLIFESRFESGNLYRATQVGEFEYDLELKCDHGSQVHYAQWFYFRFTNTRKGQ
jgi:cytosolic carboxypeptidase protein 2/3